MRRAGFVLMGLAIVLVLAGFILRSGGDDEPTPTEPEAATPTGSSVPTAPAPPSPAVCQALGPLQTLLVATVSDVEQALEVEDDAALAAAVERAVDRRARFLEGSAGLEELLPAEVRSDFRVSVAAGIALLDALATIDLTAPRAETTEQIQTDIAAFQSDPTVQTSLSALFRYLSACPAQ
jgi:hypothetical protein